MSSSVITTAELTSVEEQLSFAEIMLRAFADPAFAARYSTSPDAVLREFGISLPPGDAAPALPTTSELDCVTEDFTGISGDGTVLLTLCIMALPAETLAAH
ncbi:hypothetical protein AB0D35_19005 [Streptomyces sp. NPDC048301]|uniref:hypothetical protein n=1 Tax=unclassified Streptomyces TaxID=2593676 RepID=UPI00342B52E6